jgi:hypothetical protein
MKDGWVRRLRERVAGIGPSREDRESKWERLLGGLTIHEPGLQIWRIWLKSSDNTARGQGIIFSEETASRLAL